MPGTLCLFSLFFPGEVIEMDFHCFSGQALEQVISKCERHSLLLLNVTDRRKLPSVASPYCALQAYIQSSGHTESSLGSPITQMLFYFMNVTVQFFPQMNLRELERFMNHV